MQSSGDLGLCLSLKGLVLQMLNKRVTNYECACELLQQWGL